ncbi:hypothetical protein [Cupriavidus consociatus]|uniref:hypothetical protein n=1 Tax=Cupriavidus consociatus TaxID=2821357 RepID=UPI001AE6AF96|nr:MULTISPECIES: hypothetical protein [unclassified Cupriavidus]MBP0624017.1 hypothetical protein [Cupriavidus sp. LEh25]MDK2660727.1 hypothetical protein [Cupriavidus sp. LEh21]
MTITAAWVRTLKNCKELVVVTDSRLNGGKKMDCGQKLLTLPRSDAFICFAGGIDWAYPLMHQVVNAISTYEKSATRAQDITVLKSHVLKVFDDLLTTVHGASGDEGIPSAKFLFGGYSWIRKEFLIWRIHYHVPNLRNPPKSKFEHAKLVKELSHFVAEPAKTWHGQPWIFSGDEEYEDEARQRLTKLLHERGRSPEQVENFKFDWEPFEVVRDMLRDVAGDSFKFRNGHIGGAPQVLKVYEHLNARYLGVEWKKSDGEGRDVYVCGRRTLAYETPMLWILDPDTLVSRHPYYSAKADEQTEQPSSELDVPMV